MRPQFDLRAASALLGTGALITTPALATTASGETTTNPPAPAHAASGPTATKASSSVTVRSVRRHVVAGRRVVVKGVLRPAAHGRKVLLQVRGKRWTTVDRDRTNRRGAYRLTWRAKRPGSRKLRVRFTGTRTLRADRRSVGRVNIYRRAHASWYGPGLYGNPLACGGRLGTGTLGVAHKTLPCGTKVTLRLRGRSVRVRVIDRGPYIAGREYDLTAATKRRLGFGSTGTVLSTR